MVLIQNFNFLIILLSSITKTILSVLLTTLQDYYLQGYDKKEEKFEYSFAGQKEENILLFFIFSKP
jgi:hypothetical protein